MDNTVVITQLPTIMLNRQSGANDGPLAIIGISDHEYHQIDSEIFLMNGIKYTVQAETISRDSIIKLVRQYNQRLVVKSCMIIDNDTYQLSYAISNDSYVLDQWDWSYPIK